MNRRFFRFTVAQTLLASAVVAAFFGYAQWRRQWIRRECDLLRDHGIELRWSPDAADAFWPRFPNEGTFNLSAAPCNLFKIGSRVYTYDEMVAQADVLMSWCSYLNIPRVKTIKNGKRGGWNNTLTYPPLRPTLTLPPPSSGP